LITAKTQRTQRNTDLTLETGWADEYTIWMNNTLRNGIFLRLAHLLLTIVLVIYSFAEGMARFDAGTPSTVFEDVISVCANVLMQPMYAAYSAIPREIQSNILEWSLLAANSLLWGFGLLFLWRKVCQFKDKL